MIVSLWVGRRGAPSKVGFDHVGDDGTRLGEVEGSDGRVGRGTMLAVRAFQRKTGLVPADGYAGLKVLARLRHGL